MHPWGVKVPDKKRGTSTLVDSDQDAQITALISQEIADSITAYVTSEDILDQVYNALPRLLASLSLSLSYKGLSRVYKLAAYHNHLCDLIGTNRREIASTCRDIVLGQISQRDAQPVADNLSLGEDKRQQHGPEDKVQHSSPVPSAAKGTHGQRHSKKSQPQDREKFSVAWTYRDLLVSMPAFESFLQDLHRECILSQSEPSVIDDIRNSIYQIFPSYPKLARESFCLEIDWDPKLFIEQQGYKVPPEVAIREAIVLTGSGMAIQASTCGDYVRQTWPRIGPVVMELIANVLKKGGEPLAYLPEATFLRATSWRKYREGGSSIRVQIIGLVNHIVEVSEILVWMGAALQSSPFEDQIAYIKPVIKNLDDRLFAKRCDIAYVTYQNASHTTPRNGDCWYGLFKNPLVVAGYPISRRSVSSVGLEIPLIMMAALAQTCCVQPFAGNLFIKGISTMLVPVDSDENIIWWHLLSTNDGDRISYNAGMGLCETRVTMSDLQCSRHILGWCSDMQFLAGANAAHYSVQNSRLPKASASSPLSNTSIYMGQILTGGPKFIIGRKDISPRVTRNGYAWKLKWIAQKFVLLWDEEDKRGWLVNGTSALLHLVRTALEYDSLNEFSSAKIFDPSKMVYPEPYQAHSAAQSLATPSNMMLETYTDTKEPMRFQDHVTHFYELLEKMIDHQGAIVGGDTGLSRPRSCIEGWDFNDLATGGDPIYARQTKLDTTGMSWVDFVRSISAIVLFGRRFGDLIKPLDACPRWETVPKGQSYLAVCRADLEKIMTINCCDPHSIPARLTDEITWDFPHDGQLRCKCHIRDRNRHSDVIQVLLPKDMVSQPAQSLQGPTIMKEPRGAVIFGFNSTDPWYWPEKGPPQRSPSQPKNEVEALSLDNELRNSQVLSTPIDTNNTTRSGSSQFYLDSFTPELQSRQVRSLSPRNTTHYTVGVICALHEELRAVRMLFDNVHEDVSTPTNDANSYAFGCMGRHNIVATCLPDGEYGTTAAAAVASNMKRTCRHIQFCLVVGIGGGVPSDDADIRLGDVVVSTPIGNKVGVLPYDMVKTLEQGRFEMNGHLHAPPRALRSVLSEMRSDPQLSLEPLQPYIEDVHNKDPNYGYLGQEHDVLYASDYPHPNDSPSCVSCDVNRIRVRPARTSCQPQIHYGTIASGNQLIKDAKTRDKLGKDHNILCFEMEAAGVMNIFPCLVIRGICDYCDSHKNNRWQRYAAATAAAFAKLLLSRVRPHTQPEGDLPSSDQSGVEKSSTVTELTSIYESSSSEPKKKRRRTQSLSQS